MQIADDIYAYIHPIGANCAIFAFKDGNDVDLVDTGIRWPFILHDVLKKMGKDGIDNRRVRNIFHTHVHFDHIQADRYFQKHAHQHRGNVQVFFPKADGFRFAPHYDTIRSNTTHLLQYFPLAAAEHYRGVSIEMSLVFNSLLRYRAPANLVPFDTGEELRLGRYKAKAWCTGGHTEGHAILWLPDAPGLIVGDNDAINEPTCRFSGILESHRICRDLYSRHLSDDLLLLRGHNAALKGAKGREWNNNWFREFAAITAKLLPYFQRQYDAGTKTIDIGRILRLLTGYLGIIPVVEFFAFMRVFVILKFLQEKGYGTMKFYKNSLWFEVSADTRSLRLEL